MTEIEHQGTVAMTDALTGTTSAEHGWVAYNSGPCEWFWSATRERLEHSLTDDLRPATALEKFLLNKQGNRTHDYDAPPPQDRLRGLLDEALRVLDGYSDPTAYTDSNGDQLPPDAVLHEGLRAKDTASKIRAALAASEGQDNGQA